MNKKQSLTALTAFLMTFVVYLPAITLSFDPEQAAQNEAERQRSISEESIRLPSIWQRQDGNQSGPQPLVFVVRGKYPTKTPGNSAP